MADEIVTGGNGEDYLVQDPAVLEEWVDADLEADQTAYQALLDEKVAAAEAKSQSSQDKGVPPEKLPL